jgi:hypothetical protein
MAEMLSWVRCQRDKIDRMEAQADTLITTSASGPIPLLVGAFRGDGAPLRLVPSCRLSNHPLAAIVKNNRKAQSVQNQDANMSV